jgi:uncharacterized protein (TIGR03435 family)
MARSRSSFAGGFPLLVAAWASAQVVVVASAQPPAEFEVASVKPAADNPGSGGSQGGPGTSSPGLFSARYTALSDLIRWAFDVKPFQFKAPDWTHSARFDLDAKVPQGASRSEFRLMLQRLLVERFGLRVHQQKQEMPVYTLVVGKSGSKLKETPLKESPDSSDDSGAFDRSSVIARNDRATIRAVNEPMAYLITHLSSLVDLPVTDGTGLTGRYTFRISWTPAASIDASNDLSVYDSVSSALQAELGLKLERSKAVLDVLVVDSVARVPKEN